MPNRATPLSGAATIVLVLAFAGGGYGLWRLTRPQGDQTTTPAQVTPASAPSSAAPLTAELAYRGAPPLPFRTDKKSDRPLHTRSKYPPGTRIPVRLTERPKEGIPCTDGTFLPFLNGMTWAPAIHRDPAYGPVPPPVAILVDADGVEWWEHADGSTTTCHYIGVTAHGESYFDPTTRHSLPKPASQVLGTDVGVGGSSEPGKGGQERKPQK